MDYKEKLTLLENIKEMTQNIVNIENYLYDLKYEYKETQKVSAEYSIYGESYNAVTKYNGQLMAIPKDLAIKQAKELLEYWKEKEQNELNKLIDKEEKEFEL